VVTDSQSADDATASSELFRSHEIPVFVVGFGERVDLNELSTIATKPQYAIIETEGVTNLSKLTPNLVSLISESAKQGKVTLFQQSRPYLLRKLHFSRRRIS